MSGVFRAKYVALLRKEKVPVPQEIYNKLFDKNWVVYAKQQFHTPKYVVEYLGRYTHKIAISNYRIKQLGKADRTVTIQIKNYKKGDRKGTAQTLHARVRTPICTARPAQGFYTDTALRHLEQ
ncbi:hypothetical protein GCM10007383_06080 [Arenibacter certesii]|uniref:Transposase IS801/IS1294 domain-containing protein n=2 Tax=Arenibacter certesii TaxID=228955 RepID=A0A918MI86_9FLAO|nr:hypothetical protein GCM10007383_06080 [Arenibacter certesii]